ncbi:hypothetical protein CRE_30303 [Caenorhabditis remanei]|uniref:Uncharacterized protein n=1 Tax=Caenorhabditis remanei TaxID=31234 RepID=E3NQR9_CAERE|nr:hypothetical protein CRE_30303 [Caenorhabditis remanei]
MFSAALDPFTVSFLFPCHTISLQLALHLNFSLDSSKSSGISHGPLGTHFNCFIFISPKNQYTEVTIYLFSRSEVNRKRRTFLPCHTTIYGLYFYFFFLQMNPQKSSSFEDFAGQVVIYTEIGNAKCAKGRDLLHRECIPYTDVSLDSFPQHTQEIFDRTGTDVLPQIFFNNIYIGHETDLERVIFEKNKWESLIEHVRREKCTNGPIVPHPMNAIGFEEYDTENNNKCCEEVLWVPDEYSKLVRDMKNAQLIKNNRVSDLQ